MIVLGVRCGIVLPPSAVIGAAALLSSSCTASGFSVDMVGLELTEDWIWASLRYFQVAIMGRQAPLLKVYIGVSGPVRSRWVVGSPFPSLLLHWISTSGATMCVGRPELGTGVASTNNEVCI
jgi:hypothetical protein